MQDECGSTELALQTVLQGIVAKSAADTDCTRFDEVLLLRALRLYEKQNRLADARRLIFSACWSQLGVDRVWRVLFEGAQMEARAGNIARARCLFEFLMDHVPWYGPIYSEALRLEETGGHITSCLRIIRRGLLELRRYGPLWFGLLRMMERMDFEAEKRSWATTGSHPQLVNVKLYLPLAVINISGELVWKLYFELGQIEERAVSISAEGRAWMASEDDRCGSDDMASFRDALLGPARKAYLDSLLSCPSNLRWKVLLAGARMELSAGKIDISRDLFSEAMAVVPLKSRAHVQIECARLEEFLYNFDVAREILVMGRSDMPGEWKICLELAMHYMRGRRYCAAVESLVSAVDLHSNAGRIWALLLQLIPCAWNEDTLRMKNSMWSLFEKSNLFFNFLKCLCPLEDSKYESEGYEANYKSSIESLDLTDTEKSFESTGLVKECMKTRVVGVMPQSLLESLRQMRSVHRLVSLLALEEVPKSGECWCEAARLALNPMGYATEFDLALAHRYLSYAVLFTPQYGDSFIERIRLELLRQIMLPDILACLGIGFQCFYKTIFNCDVQDADEDLQLILRSLDCRELSPKEWMQQSGNSFKSYRKRRSLEVEKLYEMSSEIGYCGDHFRKIVLSRLYQRFAIRIFIKFLFNNTFYKNSAV